MENLEDSLIVVTDKVQKSFDFLYSVSRGTPIVSPQWLISSKKVKHFVDWKHHILKDSDAETKYEFKLTTSLQNAKNKKILDGYTVLFTPNIKNPLLSELKGKYYKMGNIFFILIIGVSLP